MAERLYVQNRRKREQRKRKIRLLCKIALIVAGCFALLYLIGRTVVKIVRPMQEQNGTYISLQEAGNLVWLLADTAAAADGAPETDADAVLAALKKMDASEGNGYLTGGQAETMLSFLPESLEAFPRSTYGKKECVEARDWYDWFDAARKSYDPQGRIRDISVTILALEDGVKENDGSAFKEGQLAAVDRKWDFFAEQFREQENWRRPITAVSRDDGLYALREKGTENGFTLSNVWVMEMEEKGIRCFWNDFEILLNLPEEKPEETMRVKMEKLLEEGKGIRDQVADLTFENGCVTKALFKNHKVSGRLLRIADNGAEIEGQGYFPFSEKLKIYRLYGRMKKLYTTDLRIGYAFTDFVIENGVIEAALVPREEKMESIRVLVKTSGFGGAYHDRVELVPDCECTVVSGKYGSTKTVKLSTGEKLVLSKDSSLFEEGDRVRIKPDILTGHISLPNVERTQGTPSYRGSLEFIKSRDGIVVINEVLLEEYLYAVVPSEMPASYPLEALKSQAVCARTYAFSKMCHAGLPAYGAHVDDSAGFQVYNNIEENTETTRAVKETKGQALFYGDDLAEAYYYSTSCGYGTDAGVWLNGTVEKYPYLMAQAVNTENMELSQSVAGKEDVAEVMSPLKDQAALLTDNAVFGSFLMEKKENFYESEEAWYRWNYQVESLDPDVINRAIAKRYEANADGIWTRQADGTWGALKPPSTGKIKEISVTKRGPGGVASELEIIGENADILVKTEHNIRYVLCDGNTQVIRQDGSSANASSMVPSAFFTIDTLKENGFVIGYTLSGGGFGHGVGLSQNGAKNMALSGKNAEEILSFFYKGCKMKDIYEISDET